MLATIVEHLTKEEWTEAEVKINHLKNKDIRYHRLKNKNTLIHALAALHAPPSLLQTVLKREPHINGTNAFGYTPLATALLFQAPLECIQTLLDGKADVLQPCCKKDELYVLHLSYYDIQITQALIERRANINAINHMGFTPLHSAIQAGALDVASSLLIQGANPNIKGASDVTPLHVAVMFGVVEAIPLLMDYKADFNAVTVQGYSVDDLAKEMGDEDVMNMLSSLDIL